MTGWRQMIEGDYRVTLPHQGGFLALTDTHLYVVRDKYLMETLALRHLTDIVTEEAHSFRHRILGIVVGTALLVLGVGILLVDVVAAQGLFHGRFAIGALFAIFFGCLFLWGVLRSRRIWWLHVRYGGTRKLIPLAGVEPKYLEEFVQILGEELKGRN